MNLADLVEHATDKQRFLNILSAHLSTSPRCVKVCGLRDADNIRAIAELGPDMMGFIFYPRSPRYMADSLSPDVVRALPASILRVGVFVNESVAAMLVQVDRFGLDAVQLHGDETPDHVAALRQSCPDLLIGKAFGVSDSFALDRIVPFEEWCDFFLFDTKTVGYGGSGQTFDWSILTDYTSSVPYLLSGGLGVQELAEVLPWTTTAPGLLGVDLNSKVEEKPGYKSPMAVRQCLAIMRGESKT